MLGYNFHSVTIYHTISVFFFHFYCGPDFDKSSICLAQHMIHKCCCSSSTRKRTKKSASGRSESTRTTATRCSWSTQNHKRCLGLALDSTFICRRHGRRSTYRWFLQWIRQSPRFVILCLHLGLLSQDQLAMFLLSFSEIFLLSSILQFC